LKFSFDTVEEYDLMWGAVHDSILYWKKVRQDAQGKICLQVDGTQTHFDEKHAIDMMIQYASVLKDIEDTPHLEWNGDKYVMTESPLEFHSHIITKTLRMVKGVDTED